MAVFAAAFIGAPFSDRINDICSVPILPHSISGDIHSTNSIKRNLAVVTNAYMYIHVRDNEKLWKVNSDRARVIKRAYVWSNPASVDS